MDEKETSGDAHEQERVGSKQPSAKPPIVGIGASAGGVQALQAFFEALPEHTGAAFVVIVHLAPESHSELPGILAARTRMQVTQVHKPASLEPDHVYVIPPDRHLRISDNEISAHGFDNPRGQRAPIDLFFRSLSEQRGDGFAIVLTGAGSDGAVGIKAVKEAGGIILVQDPNEAEYASMPRSAIATGLADFVLPLREIATCVVELMRNRELALGQLRGADEEYVRRILAYVCARTGHDFSQYKKSTVLRRIARRTQVTRREQLADYFAFLRDNVEEVQALFGDLLISVTTFFRDPKAFEALAKHAIPPLFEGKEPSDSLRVWVPGCATGEEAYAIAMLLLEEAARHEIRPRVQVFGSDLDAGALAVARQGRYPIAIEADISQERLHRFFSREGDHYRAKQELRDVLLFASHSLLKDPPFSRLDLVSCRNLLIYLDRELQQQVCSIFHYALNPKGFLFLGSSESADSPLGLFRAVDREARIYQESGRSSDKQFPFPKMLGTHRVTEDAARVPRGVTRAAVAGEPSLHRLALEKNAPPSILVDEAHRAVHLSESAGRFLQPSGGPLTSDVTELVRQELRSDLRAALHQAFERGESTLSLPIMVSFNGLPHRVYLQVRPVQKEDARARRALVLFIEGGPIEQMELAELPDEKPETSETVRRLKEELQRTQARLRATREESESANEELRAANEELQSINEEYRSTSEELETSKEELQSINEELQTVNNELKTKLVGVSRAHSDLQNLMASTDVGTVFLDTALRIKLFTPYVTGLFNITAGDEGRPITDFTHQLDYDGLAGDARAVLENLTPIDREIHSLAQSWYLMRLRPYRTVDNKIDGVVVTFVEVTERRKAEEALRQSEERLRQQTRLIEMSQEPIFIWDFDAGIVEWNRGSEQLYGYSREETLGKKKNELLETSVPGSSFAELKQELLDSGSWSGELKQRTKDGRPLTVESRIELVPLGDRRLVLETTRDVTERKTWELRQKLLLSELTHRVKNTLTVVQSMAHQTLRGSRSSEDFVESFDGRLSALASAHKLLVDSQWQGAELGALARNQLEPYVSNVARLRMEGEAINLPAELATPFGLVLHELATNAAKYGSLSGSKGTVELSWGLNTRSKERLLTVQWQEHGGPPVVEPKATGFGSSLIQKGLPNSKVRHEFRPGGVVCTIELPMPEVAESGTSE
jgi:two-component system, chemotaxis family, CheB/CheR fusion protein